jgi:hypothetical protein
MMGGLFFSEDFVLLLESYCCSLLKVVVPVDFTSSYQSVTAGFRLSFFRCYFQMVDFLLAVFSVLVFI